MPNVKLCLRFYKDKGMDYRSNTKAESEALIARCKQALDRGRSGGLAALKAFREAGAALRELKQVVPHGEFGRVADELCGCTKQWRALLMKLDREWSDAEAALKWAEGEGRDVEANYSVDGALALVRTWRRTLNGGTPKAPHKPRVNKAQAAALLRENLDLKERLAAAQACINVLSQRLAEFQTTETGVTDIDEPTVLKLQKVAELWRRGGTAGERTSAVYRLFGIADRLGRDLPTLLHDCGIESPVNFTFGSAAN
jgi:hypothetical protein